MGMAKSMLITLSVVGCVGVMLLVLLHKKFKKH